MPRPHILLVDDNAEVREMTAMLLSEQGFDVTEAIDATAALSRLRQTAFTALATDHSMPGMTGAELIDAARQMHPGLPCLLVTGFGTALGNFVPGVGIRLLRKPFRAAALAASLRELIGP